MGVEAIKAIEEGNCRKVGQSSQFPTRVGLQSVPCFHCVIAEDSRNILEVSASKIAALFVEKKDTYKLNSSKMQS